MKRKAVRISFLQGREQGIYAAGTFSARVTSWFLPNNMQYFFLLFFFINIIFIAQWQFLPTFEILHCFEVFACCQNLCKPERILQTHVNFFLLWKYDVISQLRLGYAKGPFCVTRLTRYLKLNVKHILNKGNAIRCIPSTLHWQNVTLTLNMISIMSGVRFAITGHSSSLCIQMKHANQKQNYHKIFQHVYVACV